MPAEGRPETCSRSPESSVMILHIDRRGEEQPLRLAAVIRNLGAGLATLEVANPWTVMEWETLKGRKARLSLQSPETGKSIDIRGTVTWARFTGQEEATGLLSLGLALAEPDQLAKQLLFEHITHTSDDIKGLWNRWEQVRQSSSPRTLSTKIGFGATALLFGALAMQLAAPQGVKIFGWVLWFCGTLLVASQTLRFWKHRNAPQ